LVAASQTFGSLKDSLKMGEQALLILAALAPLPLGIAVLVAQHLISAPRDPLRDDPVNLIVTTVGWALIVVGLVWPLVGLLGVFSILGFFIAVFVLIEGLRMRRASQQNALLWLLTVSAERSMPLGPALDALSRERGGGFGRRTKRLAELLAAGAPLPDALDLCPGLLPAYTLPMIRIGSQTGALADALRQAADVNNQNAPLFMSVVGKISYLLLLPFFGVLVLSFVMVWIIPKFQAIFHDFGTRGLPPMTQALVQASYFFINYWYLFLPLILFGAWLLGYMVARYFGLTLWDMPPLDRLAGRLDSARILDALAVVARQRRPLAEGIATLALSYPKRNIRRRLTLAAFDIEAGGDWADSLARRDLIRQADHAVLQAAQRANNLPWAMQEMADSARRRFFYKLQAIIQAVFPAGVICFGLVVMFIVVALFLPLVNLIQKLA
jgi:type II secretory pathway component PulF